VLASLPNQPMDPTGAARPRLIGHPLAVPILFESMEMKDA
jgi:hypothetical protein